MWVRPNVLKERKNINRKKANIQEAFFWPYKPSPISRNKENKETEKKVADTGDEVRLSADRLAS